MNCVILQPSYIPWRGIFEQIAKADYFVFFDDAQYDPRGWRNRNRIKTPHGPRWLSIPVLHKGCQISRSRICDMRICYDTPWQRKHWRTLKDNYGRTPFFDRYAPLIEGFFQSPHELLCDLTIALTIALARAMGIRTTRFLRSSRMPLGGNATGRTGKLLDILSALPGATHYITGPSARNYLEEEQLYDAGYTVEYMRYDYPEYPQLHPPFDPYLSILDLLFMTGPDAARYLTGNRTDESPETVAAAALELSYGI